MSGENDNVPSAEDFTKLQGQFAELQTQLTSATEERDRFKSKHGEAEKHRKKADDDAKIAVEEALRKSGDFGALEDSYKEKATEAQKVHGQEVAGLNQVINDVTVGAAATALANKITIAGSASVVESHLKERMRMEMRDGVPHVGILGKDGKMSALSHDDLGDEFQGMPSFAPIMKGSSASGSGAVNKGGDVTGKTMKRSDYDKLPPGSQRKAVVEDKITIVDD